MHYTHSRYTTACGASDGRDGTQVGGADAQGLPSTQTPKTKVGTKLGYWGRHVSMGGLDAENRERAQLQM